MSIGETLAQARRQSGLTVAEVSRRTRIRETLVRDIERDDYSACGGDFYTRGHIRAIARVVGTDSEPLIAEYDAAHQAPAAHLEDTAPQFAPARTSEWPPRELDAEPPTDPFQQVTLIRTPAGAPPQRPREPQPPQARQPPAPQPQARQQPQAPQRPEPSPEPLRPPPSEPPAGVPHHVVRVGADDWQELLPEPPPREPPPAIPYHYGPGVTGGGGPRRRNWPVLFGVILVVVLGFLGYYFVSGSGRASPGGPAAGSSAPSSPGQSPGSSQAAGGSAHQVVVHLTAARAVSVVFTTPGGKYLFRATIPAGGSKKWTFRHPVNMRLADPDGAKLVVDGKNPLPHGSPARPVTLTLSPGHPAVVATPNSTPTPAGTPAPAIPLTDAAPLTPASATSFSTSGAGQGDNEQLAPMAIDGNRGTAWNTDWYTNARFGNLYPGTGLLIDMGKPVTISSAAISLGGAPGAAFQLRVGPASSMADLSPVARAGDASGTVHLRLSTPAHGRYVLIWFTRLPLTRNGNFEASVYNVKLAGRT